jgi:hypothetical protein
VAQPAAASDTAPTAKAALTPVEAARLRRRVLMTEVAFHFNAPDKLGYVCRFVRKALRHGAQVTVTAQPGVLAHLSARL